MTQRQTFLLLLPAIMMLSFTTSKQVKPTALAKTATVACATTFNVELRGCQTDNFALDYISVSTSRHDLNVGCSNYAGTTYVGADAFENGPTTLTIHSSYGTAAFVDVWDHHGVGSLEGYVGGYFGNGTNTISISPYLIGCGESYTIRVFVQN